jgi:chemotaxis protein histidine kinase CheA
LYSILYYTIVAIEKHFEDFNEDQFDFHAYCIRKVTLRSYVQVLRWEDNLWGHDIYADAAEAIISTYLNLFDHPPKLDDDENKEPDYSKMTPAERKKAKAQARKKKKKAEKKAEEDAKKAEEAAKEKKKNGKTAVDQPPKDKDPDGKELLKMDPLEQAKKYISTLVKNAPTRISTWLYQYDVAVRRKKYFIALQALNKAKKIQSYYDNGDVFTRMVDFANLDIKAHDNAHVQEVFESEKSTLFDGKSLSDFVSSVADKAKNSKSNLSVQVAVAKAMTRVGVGSAKEACDIITSKGLNVHGVTLSTCADSVQYLKDLGGDDDEYVRNARDEWIGKLKSRYFLTTLF